MDEIDFDLNHTTQVRLELGLDKVSYSDSQLPFLFGSRKKHHLNVKNSQIQTHQNKKELRSGDTILKLQVYLG